MYQPKRMFPTFEMMIGRGKCNMKLPTAQWGYFSQQGFIQFFFQCWLNYYETRDYIVDP